MSTITFSCHACRKMLRVPGDKAGKKAKCGQCGAVLTVPDASDDAAPMVEAVSDRPPPRQERLHEEFDDRPRQTSRQRAAKPFAFDGGAGDFFVCYLLAGLLTVFTLGIGFPWALCMFQRWKDEHTLVEGRRLVFKGTGLGLFGNWIIWFLLSMITLGIYTFWMVPAIQRWIADNTDFAEN